MGSRMLRFLPLAGLTATSAALLLGACGGSGNDTGVSPGGDSPAAVSSLFTGGEGAEQADLRKAASPASTPLPPEPRQAIARAAELFGHQPFRMAFLVNMEERGLGTVGGTLTIAAKGAKSRATLEGTYAGHDGAIAVAREPGADYLCIDGQGQQACLKIKPDAVSPVPLPVALELPAMLQALADDSTATFVPANGYRAGGRSGHCWKVTGNNVVATVCVADSDGTLLMYEGALRGAKGSIRLKEFEKSASDGDVKPPYEVTELPGY